MGKSVCRRWAKAGECHKKSLEHAPYERLKWRVLKEFGALPAEERARKMTDRDFLWCVLNLMLDDEETLALLCPRCRSEAEEGRCPACGASVGRDGKINNAAFESERFQLMKRGEQV